MTADSLLDDARGAVRSIRARPLGFLVLVLCLSLGVGVNIALFGMVDALLLRPPIGVDRPESLVRIEVGLPRSGILAGAGPSTSEAQYRRVLEEREPLFEDVALYSWTDGTLDGGASAREVRLNIVTSNYFDVLGVAPRLGRTFDASEGGFDRPATVAVLSYDFWQEVLAASPDVLGSTIRVNGLPLTVIGVAPERFIGIDLGDPDLWVPASLRSVPAIGGVSSSFQMFARMRPGQDTERISSLLAEEHVRIGESTDPFEILPLTPDDFLRPGDPIPVTVVPLRTAHFTTGGQNPAPVWFLAVSGTALLLACATAVNLMLAENVRRRRELAVRLALGASPRRLMSAQLWESGLIALTATGGAFLFGAASVALVRLLPIPPVGPLIGWHNVALGAALALATPLVFGIIPALWSARRDASDVFRKAVGTPAAIATQRRMMAAQIGVAFALILVGGLFFRSLSLLLAFDTGADLDHVLSVRSDPVTHLPGVELAQIDRYADIVRGVPGVVGVSVASNLAFASGGATFRIMDGRADTMSQAGANIIGPQYFDVTGIPVVAGRALGELDRVGTPPVAMVSADLAEQLWPQSSPLGSCVRLRYVLARPYGDACIEVVGIAGATRSVHSQGEVDDHPTLYLSANQAPASFFDDVPLFTRQLLVRTAGDPEALIAPLRARLQSADPTMPFLVQGHPLLRSWETPSFTHPCQADCLSHLLAGGGSGRALEEPVEVAQPVAAAVDVDDVHVVEQAVEDGGGEDLVAGEDLGPVPTCLFEVRMMEPFS